jgi:hypothetical protein
MVPCVPLVIIVVVSDRSEQKVREQSHQSIHSQCLHIQLWDLMYFDPLSSFDMDSSIWVCDNSVTGHICYNKALFANELVSSIFQVGSATGISVPNLMGTVILQVTDDKGTRQSFTLTNVIYLPNSQVNILFLSCLAELYPNDDDQLDEDGTGICSGYASHTMNWDKALFNKMCFKPLCLVFQNAFLALDI